MSIAFMARPGRKAKSKGIMPERGKKRSPDRGTQEFQARRIAAVGVELATHQAAGDVLGILMLKGHITEAQRAAGARYALLRGRVCGSPHGSTGSYGERTEASTNDGPSKKDQRAWERCLAAVYTLGSIAKMRLDDVAVYNYRPTWSYGSPMRFDQLAERSLLVAALRKLEDVT